MHRNVVQVYQVNVVSLAKQRSVEHVDHAQFIHSSKYRQTDHAYSIHSSQYKEMISPFNCENAPQIF